MKIEIDLNLARKDSGGAIASPAGDSEQYPEVYLRGDKELNLPEEGTITFRYAVIEEKHSERKYEASYSCTLCLKELVSVEPAKDMRPAKADKSTENALDALAKLKDDEDDTDESATEGY